VLKRTKNVLPIRSRLAYGLPMDLHAAMAAWQNERSGTEHNPPIFSFGIQNRRWLKSKKDDAMCLGSQKHSPWPGQSLVNCSNCRIFWCFRLAPRSAQSYPMSHLHAKYCLNRLSHAFLVLLLLAPWTLEQLLVWACRALALGPPLISAIVYLIPAPNRLSPLRTAQSRAGVSHCPMILNLDLRRLLLWLHMYTQAFQLFISTAKRPMQISSSRTTSDLQLFSSCAPFLFKPHSGPSTCVGCWC
jgi:hypothetical protein